MLAKRRRHAQNALVFLGLFVLVLGRLASLKPRELPLREDQEALLQTLAKEPRTPGSQAHARTRELLLRELSGIGFEVETQHTTSYSTRWGVPYDVARVDNVVAKLKGRDPSHSIALLAHYDSVPQSKGAADDASGVLALLEAAKSLSKGEKPRNNIVLVFSDAEEAGVLGSRAFVAEHRFFQDIRVALNFDARGGRGPLGLVETSRGGGALVRQFASHAPDAVASSVFPDVRRLLGNETDLAPFLQSGVAGMNFALADGYAYYHAPLDDAANLDRGSLAQVLRQATGVARQFGDLPLESIEPEELSYFDLPALGVVSYSNRWVLPLALLVALLCFGFSLRGMRQRDFSGKQLAASFASWLLVLALGAAAGACVIAVLRLLTPIYGAFRSDPGEPLLARLALVCLVCGVHAVAFRSLQSRLPSRALFFGAFAIVALLGLCSAVLLPGASYLFTIPLFAAIAAEAAHRGSTPNAPMGIPRALALVSLSAPIVALVVPIPYMLFVALGLPSAMAPLAFVSLLLFLLAPTLEISGFFRSFRPALLCFALATVLLGESLVQNRFSKNNPRPSCIAYALDADASRAYWLSTDKQISPGLTDFFLREPLHHMPIELPGQGTPRHASTAPLVDLKKPELVLLADENNGSTRILRYRLRSMRSAPFVLVSVDTKAQIRAGVIDGKRIEERQGFHSSTEEPWGFTFQPMPVQGIDWSLELSGSSPQEPLVVRVVDRSYELPESAIQTPMPEDEMPMPFRIANSTFVQASFRY